MDNRTALFVSGGIIIGFFIAGLFGILNNSIVKFTIIIAFIAYVGFLVKQLINNHKKNLPK